MSKVTLTTLGDLVEFQRGFDLPKSEFKVGQVPVISSNGILGYHNVAKVKAPGITIGRSGTVGLPHFINKDFFPHNTSLFIKDFKGNNPKYIFYLLKTLKLNEYGSGSGVPTMNRNHLHPIKVSAYLDYNYQSQIASVLSALDSKIELNNRINAELEAMAKTLYDYWFVQFDFPDKNGKPYKTSGGKMVWNEGLKREIPEGWEVQNLSKIANITTGKLDSNAEVIGAAYPFYTCASDPSTTDTFAFDDTVILVAGNNAAGNFHINRHKGKFNAYQRTYIFTSKNQKELEYLYQVLKTETKALKSQGKGSQTKFLTIGMLTSINTFTKTSIMNKYNDVVKPMYEQQVVIRMQNQKLSELRDWLLPMLMNGQVRVSEL